MSKWRRVSMVLVALIVGCKGSMTPGKMQWVQINSDAPRAGNVYLIRGFIGLFSFGIDRLTVKINEAGIRAHVFQEDQARTLAKTIAATYRNQKNPEPLCLVGHSLGADRTLDVARELQKYGIAVDAVLTMDPTRPPTIPANVKLCYNFYQPSFMDSFGILRGVKLEQEPGSTGKLFNYNIRAERKDLLEPDTNHVNVDKNTRIHKEIIDRLLEVCPPREQWVKNHPQPATTDPPGTPAGR